MNQNELVPTLIFSGMALAAALGLILVQASFLEAENRVGRRLMPIILPMIILAIMLSSLSSGRNLKYAGFDMRSISGQAADGGGNLLRLFTAVLLAVSFAKILGSLLNRKQAVRDHSASQTVHLLYLSFLAYFFGNVVLPSAFGSHPAFVHNALYAVVVFSAAYFSRKADLGLIITWAKAGLLLMMLGSLFAAVVIPELAIQADYQGWIPGLKGRLWGLSSNANSIGPLALTLLLLEFMQPSPRAWLRWLTWMAAILVLIAAQSKTVWAIAIFVVVLLYIYGRVRGTGGISMQFVLLVIGLLLIVGISLAFVDTEKLLQKLSLSQAGADISTLTGRTRIWAVALQVWAESPAFGYGLTAWGPQHRSEIGMQFAFHAHNQLLQSMSVAGTVGAITTLLYFFFLLRRSWQVAAQTKGVSLALMALITFRCLSEAPLELTGLFIGETFMHLLLFIIVIHSPVAADRSTAAR